MKTTKFSREIDSIRKELDKKEKLQQECLMLMKDTVRLAGKAINDIHQGKEGEAKEQIEQAGKLLEELREKAKGTFDSYLAHGEQEYCEARGLLEIVTMVTIPSPVQLKIGNESFLNGLCDLIGELRRKMLNELIAGKKARARMLFSIMESILDEISTLKYSDSILPEFRRKQDVARIQVEQARGEIFRGKG